MSIDTHFSSQEHYMQSADDTVLEELRITINPIVDKIDQDETTERAILCIAAKDEVDKDGNTIGIQSFIDCAGDYGLIQEALYTELTALIEAGEPNLFESIRQVVQQIEQEQDLEPGETLHLTPPSRTLH